MKRKRNPHRVQAVDSAKEKTHMPVATTSHSRCLQQNRGKNSPGAGQRPHGPQAPPSPCSLPSANARGPGTALATLPDSLLHQLRSLRAASLPKRPDVQLQPPALPKTPLPSESSRKCQLMPKAHV